VNVMTEYAPRLLREGRLAGVMRATGAAFLIATAALHVAAFPDHFRVAGYIGLSFLLYAVMASTSAVALARGVRGGWPLGALVAGAAFALYVIARTVGLPAYSEDDWIDPLGGFPLGIVSFALEGLVVALYVAASIDGGVRGRGQRRRGEPGLATSSSTPVGTAADTQRNSRRLQPVHCNGEAP